MRTKAAAILLAALTLSLFAPSHVTEAQPAARGYRVGVLLGAPAATVDMPLQAFRDGLRELGYVEGQNLALEVISVTSSESELDRLAANLVRAQLDVLVTWPTPSTLAAMRATSTVPIVTVSAGDPVGNGLVTSLARPGGNVTGVSNVSRDLSGKLLELLREVHPGATRIAALRNPTNPASEAQWRETQAAAQALGVQLQLVPMQAPGDLDAAFAAMVEAHLSGVVVLADPLFLAERNQIAILARKARLPTAFQRAENVEAGGLMSYGPKLTDQFRQAAAYVDKLLRGAKPADLPVEQPTQFELVLNLKTAKALGLTIPQSLLLRADEVLR